MELLETMDTVARQEWLDPASDGVQRVVSEALHPPGRAGTWLDNMLNGTWLGHPLHPVLTDVPVGAWTVGLLLDGLESFTPKKELAAGADAANWIGIAGAVGSAVTGLAQWQYTIDRQKRLGMAHALLNTGALALYGASAALRARGQRGAGKLAALLGYAVVAASAYIGGDLVYAERIGVNHVPEESPPAEFTPALPEAELPEDAMARVAVGRVPILLAWPGRTGPSMPSAPSAPTWVGRSTRARSTPIAASPAPGTARASRWPTGACSTDRRPSPSRTMRRACAMGRSRCACRRQSLSIRPREKGGTRASWASHSGRAGMAFAASPRLMRSRISAAEPCVVVRFIGGTL